MRRHYSGIRWSKVLICVQSKNFSSFKKRLKDENRKTDEKEIGEKRPILESPPPRESKKKLQRKANLLEVNSWDICNWDVGLLGAI
ncbi:hypothetical protein GLOIN_2v1780646 [Rhizophagus irregularis DAOM 181602=DAOM 197198]|nr:hypothetical protein GLOIN_2v1780646 [Rhizophagus irregularis DAOM 181602=DAOM 197198]